MRRLHFECISGISGDMILGALIDMGAPQTCLYEAIEAVGLSHECRVEITKDFRAGISGTLVKVIEIMPDNSHGHHANHRHWHHIKEMLENSRLSDAVKQMAINVFETLAIAEGSVHGVTPEEVHFHEVGAVDSIVDIVGSCALIHALQVDDLTCSTIEVGGGTVKCQHGVLPVPAPAVAQLLIGKPISSGKAMVELATPTGVSVAVALCSSFGTMPSMQLAAVGVGLGMKKLEHANVLRVFLGEDGLSTDQIIQLEANIDDMTGEELAFAMQSLFAAGALDVYMQPIYMKKNRPGTMLCALCKQDRYEVVKQAYFTHTTTLGIREKVIDRTVLPRILDQVSTPYGSLGYKRAGSHISAEFEDAAAVAQKHQKPLREIMRMVESQAEKKERL